MAARRGPRVLVALGVLAVVACSSSAPPQARPDSAPPQAGPDTCAGATQQALADAGPVAPVPLGPDVEVEAVDARPASAFVDSVGVNIHVTYTDTPYVDHDTVLKVLRDSGIRHVRDGVVPGRLDVVGGFLDRLEAQGDCAQLIVGGERVDDEQLARSIEFLGEHADVLAGVEGPNELDRKEVPGDWEDLARDQQERIFEGVRDADGTAPVPVASLSVGRLRAFEVPGDVSDVVDLVNLHPYPGGEPPEGAIEPHAEAAQELAEDAPALVTETGYHDALNDEDSQPAVSEEAEAVYLPRLLLDAYAIGVVRTYLYELVDEFPDVGDSDDQASFGLYRRDWSPKPAATSVTTLLELLSSAPTSDARSLELAVRAPDDADLRTLLLSDGDGYWLALWRAVSIYDNEDDELLEPSAVSATLQLGEAADVDVYRLGDSAEPVAGPRDATTVPVEVTGRVQLLRLTAP